MDKKLQISSYLQGLSQLIILTLFVAFPIVISTNTTDLFTLPKQILLGTATLLLLVIFALKSLIEKSVKIRTSIFDLPVFLFALVVIFSSLFSLNRLDSLTVSATFLFAVFAFFLITNILKEHNFYFPAVLSLAAGGAILSIVSILSYFNVYFIPIPATHIQTFSLLGSFLDQAIYLLAVLAIILPDGIKALTNLKTINIKNILFTLLSIIIIMGLSITLYFIFSPSNQAPNPQRLTVLPFETGFQTAFAAISQDSGRILQGFLLGSGFGTYLTDFTRFKQASFNQNPALWNLSFLRSSNYLLELLATTGALGISAFLFIIIRASKIIIKNKKDGITLAMAILALASLFVPFSFVTQTLFFIVLGLFACLSSQSSEIELQLVAFQKGLIALEAPTERKKEKSIILPIFLFVAIAIVVLGIGYYSQLYVRSDIKFQQSLIAASKNNGAKTYKDQADAISLFPYRDGYRRVFAQTNLVLANSLASQIKPGSTPNTQTQNTITTLIQQSITEAKNATSISPLTSSNWQSLSSVYRSLIGFGQNAENFAVASQQQAILLDSNNPQQYINLGGIYYQLSQWDNAQNQFKIAVNLKPDLANSHYNLGHSLEQKGDFENALIQYQAVKTLVANEKNSLDQISREISALEEKVKNKSAVQTPSENKQASNQPPLNLNSPSAQLPPQHPPVKIPAPNTATGSGQ